MGRTTMRRIRNRVRERPALALAIIWTGAIAAGAVVWAVTLSLTISLVFLLTEHALAGTAGLAWRAHRAKALKGQPPPSWSAQASRGFRLDASPHTALAWASEELKRLRLVAEPELGDGVLHAETDRDTITVTARRAERWTIVNVESHPSVPEMFDRGRNQAIVDTVVESLTSSNRRPLAH